VGRAVVCKYGVSCRDLEEMMEERGVALEHTTLNRWVQRYAPEIEKRLRWAWRAQQVAGMSTRPIPKYVVGGFISTGHR
jgi:transposase-like protein